MSKWISVKDKLPDNKTNVLCYSVWRDDKRLAHITVRRFAKHKFVDSSMRVTHWMPLPKPPIATP